MLSIDAETKSLVVVVVVEVEVVEDYAGFYHIGVVGACIWRKAI